MKINLSDGIVSNEKTCSVYAFALTKRHDRHEHFRRHGKRRLSVAGHPSLYPAWSTTKATFKTFKELATFAQLKTSPPPWSPPAWPTKSTTSALNNVSNTEWVKLNLSVNLANAGSSAVIGTAINGGSLQTAWKALYCPRWFRRRMVQRRAR